MSTLVLCASRGRPDAARELLASYMETFRDPGSRLIFVLDRDDPSEYPGEVVRVRGGSFGKALRGFTDYGDATSVGVVGDDCRFRTPGWDRLLDGWLTENVGVAWPSDGWDHPWDPETKAAHWWLSRPVVDAFGIAPPTEHLFMDDYWAALGNAAGAARYFPEILVEHLHPLAGKGTDDATYQRHRQYIGRDRDWYRMWKARSMEADVRKLRRLAGRTAPMRVFADWHHPSLWEALSIVIEDRFGGALFSPEGMEWKRHGYRLREATPGWSMADYLREPGAEPEYPERLRKTVTWEEWEASPWDVIIASVGVHQQPFAELAKQKGATYVHHIGDAKRREVPVRGGVTIASARVRADVIHHQEFDRELFAYSPVDNPSSVSSFMLRLDSTSGPYDWLANAPGIEWNAVECEAMRGRGYLAPMSLVAERMRRSGWVWHDKRIGDGFGHVLWTAAAMGRPLIGHASNYRGQMGEDLWEDGVTCIDLDRHSPPDALRRIRRMSPVRHEAMGFAIRERFDRLVDFDAEAEAIRSALT